MLRRGHRSCWPPAAASMTTPGTERYWVRGGGSATLRLYRDDTLSIVDVEGRQRCDLATFTLDGHRDTGALRDVNTDVPVLTAEGAPGSSVTFLAARDSLCRVSAPGAPMRADAQDPPTDLQVQIRRARPASAGDAP